MDMSKAAAEAIEELVALQMGRQMAILQYAGQLLECACLLLSLAVADAPVPRQECKS